MSSRMGNWSRFGSHCIAALIGMVALYSAIAPTLAAAAPALGLQWSRYGRYLEGGEWATLQKSGAALVRLPMTPKRSGDGTNDGTSWGTYYDKVFQAAAEHGITILPQLGGRRNDQLGFPYNEWSIWKAWARGAVKRYGYNGTFWSAHPSIPAKPVIAWEIWNEPNLYNDTRDDAAGFAKLVAEAGPAMQTASQEQSGQGTGIILGGLSMTNEAVAWRTYLNAMYATVPTLNSAYTGLGIHPYQLKLKPAELCQAGESAEDCSIRRTAEAARTKTAEVVDYVKNNWGASKSAWVTEIGWSLGHNPPVNAAEKEVKVTEAQQSKLLTASFNQLKGIAETKNVKAIIWYNDRDFDDPSSAGWQERCGLRDEVGNFRPAWYAFQQQTGASAWPSATGAFQANTESLFTYTRANWGVNTLWGMTGNPSIGQHNGSYKIAFRANTGNLWTMTPPKSIDTGLAVAAGTSPAISSLYGGSVAFRANTGNLWIYKEGGTVANTGYGMAPGTSPSITAVERNNQEVTRYPIAFQGNTNTLWIHEPGGTFVGWNSLLKMAPGTSPSIAALDRDGNRKEFVVAYQAADTTLSFMEPEYGVVASTGFGMAPGTSPSVTALPNGKFAIAFQANTGQLWTYVPEGPVVNTGLGMEKGTSPSITPLHDHPNGAFKVLFMANTASLWSYEPGGYVENTILGNEPGTSPSVSPG